MATDEQFELVSFERPPVEEVAFSVQLADPTITIDALAELGQQLRPEFPVQQLQPALPRIVERLDDDPPTPFQMRVGAQLPRVWFVSDDGHRLVQAQEDRLALNWRRLGGDTEYPRYGRLRSQFSKLLGTAAEVLGASEGLRADLCELTYVNELELAGGGKDERIRAEQVLSAVSRLDSGEFLPPSDDSRWGARWLIRDAAGVPIGRLEANAEPAVRQRDQRHIYLLTMTVRLIDDISGIGPILEKIDIAHEWIVKGFVDLTSQELHDYWGRTK